ncbi:MULTISPECIES: aspartate/glutamate racemase family protein [Nguyenibacter]|uniref:Aspartate/glutamate racemase family protein n=1 Tax=Nguyenibacter vanlangensis TaxID=1216886 RepID=A0A7Y7IT92_9PROT|nr:MULTISPECIES: aspartate/glutamate racemase family protein [Nguyenibacter]NVN09902.1 aspartate/glutamate racemase family protein [Nguyenibacter vanlangensis]WRH89115.1 aspartate/glutamate racemase family protein [Nguyenibacter sp. L1]
MASMIAQGGRAIYGVPLGILMLEARFPRIPGDMGNAETWPFPVQLCVVEGATPERIVLGDPRAWLEPFIGAAKRLIDLGVSAITTNCGFLALLQPQLAAALNVPVATSSLMQIPWVNATLPPGRRAGIVTICAATLTQAHLAAVGAPTDTPVIGTEDGAEFFRVLIKAESETMDVALAERDVVAAAQALVAQHPDVGAIVLECTNMPPYAAAVAAATGLPVYDIYSMVTWFVAGIRPRVFSSHYSRL